MKASAFILFTCALTTTLSPAFAAMNCLCHDKQGKNRVLVEGYEGTNCADLVTDANAAITLDTPVAGRTTCSQKDIGDHVDCAYKLERVHMAVCTATEETTL